jgi:sugar O-acyltransferase (sialic acid O-acetyltransferase NeuD family)
LNPAALVLWGASGHAGVVIDALRSAGRADPLCLIDDVSDAGPPARYAVPILRSLQAATERLGATALMHIAVGDCDARLQLAARAAQSGWAFGSVIHPSAVVAPSATIGPGCFVAAGAVVASGARLGAHCIVNTGASVDHDCELDDGVHVAPGAVLGGHVRIGRGAWIGLGACVRDRVAIQARALIGVGAVVVANIAADTVAVGCPARPLRLRP